MNSVADKSFAELRVAFVSMMFESIGIFHIVAGGVDAHRS